MSSNNFSSAWKSLCPPAQIYPIFMSSLILFNLYRGTYRYAVSHFVAAFIGTIFLWILCAAGLGFAAYALLIFPVFFFIVLLAIVFYDQSLLEITSTYTANASACKEPETCDSCPTSGC